ncbi:MAG TPA: flavodoxin reductase [Cyclobacteriaceae bacterium]|nr:flavodoxin reductase [Cyclobacteriaceae bacterium]
MNTVKIKSIDHLTHDVLKIITEKPSTYSFAPGQATEISINKVKWKNKRRPFTFTCLPENDYLEFAIKTYPAHHGVTNQLLQLQIGEELILHDVFGAIHYEGEGVFIAGGAGVTPFISILRFLDSKNEIGNNKLIFANKTRDDIILEGEFKELLRNNFINILSRDKADGYAYGHITEEFLRSNLADFNKKIYLCGPDPMMLSIEQQLGNLGVEIESIIKEKF